MGAPTSATWSYLLVCSNELGSFEEIKRAIDTNPKIVNWYTCLPNSFFLASSYSASDLADDIRGQLGDKRFIILDTNADRGGWLPGKAWEFMKNPRPVGG
jgi:hypothetical protein